MNPLYGDYAERAMYEPPGPWRSLAACRGIDPNLFVPERGEDSTEAKKVCRSCPAVHECLVYGLSNPTAKGVWGGLSGEERQALRRVLGRMYLCSGCGEAFHSYRHTEAYCGEECRRSAHLKSQAASRLRRDVA